MRINFSNTSIPTRAAKRLKQFLAIKESEARRVTAFVFGFRNWTDLNNEHASGDESALDEACEPKTLQERRRYQAQRLREAGVELSNRTAEEVIDWWQPSAGHPQAPLASKPSDGAPKRSVQAQFLEALLILEKAPDAKAEDYADALLQGIQECTRANFLKLAGIIASKMLSGERPREPELARRMLEALAAKREPASILNLSASLMMGNGGAKDIKRAGDLLESLANDSSASADIRTEARSRLGSIHAHGMERRADPIKALKLWEEAAKSGDPTAAYNLGCLYQDGLGVRENIDKAVGYFREAADVGHVDASGNLGILLTMRPDLALHIGEPEQRLTFAAERGSKGAKAALLHINRRMAGILADLDAGRLPEQQVREVQDMILDMAMGHDSPKDLFKNRAPAAPTAPRRTRKK